MEIVNSIGAQQKKAIVQLENISETARLPDFPEVEALIDTALSHLHECHVRITVVGQVKAGKSSLINALSGTDGLLPTEVNPWTAVITHLQFGHNDKPQSGGAFQLFSNAEWEQMLEGDPKTRSLTEALLPGFDSSVLKQQIEEMQENARQRLGGLYQHLLGKKHSYNSITPEILERYVSAGYQSDNKANAGRFSGITKSAEVYLPLEPFALPVTMSDTPGINDPFLVRDEITTGSFRDTDIFVVALSVHQALSAADMALLKMLSCQPGKATLIYVNRIDELENPATGVGEVLQTLENRLKSELKYASYTLVAGSAIWGDIALNGSDRDVEKAASSAGFEGYCTKQNISDSVSLRERLYAASGIPEVADVLSVLIAEGPGKNTLSKVASEVSVAMSIVRSSLEDRLSNSDVVLLDVGDIPAIVDAEKTRLIDSINNLADLADELDKNEGEIREKMLSNSNIVSKSIANIIEATLYQFVEAQSDILKTAFSKHSSVNSWSLDTGDLCQRIESQTIESYHEGRQEMDLMIRQFAGSTSEKMTATVGEVKFDKLLDHLPHDEIMLGYKPSTSLVDIELSKDRGWKFWEKNEMTEAEAIARIKQVIRQEMLSGTTSCCEVASLAIAERTGVSLSLISEFKNIARNLIVEEVTALKSEVKSLDKEVTKDTIARINAKRKTQTNAWQEQLTILTGAETDLATHFPEYTKIPITGPVLDGAETRGVT